MPKKRWFEKKRKKVATIPEHSGKVANMQMVLKAVAMLEPVVVRELKAKEGRACVGSQALAIQGIGTIDALCKRTV